MAFVVARGQDRWELRQSAQTPKGPRSLSLASFSRLDDATLKHAAQRATKPFDVERVRASARRAGAPVDLPETEQAGRLLVAKLSQGATLSPTFTKLLQALLAAEPHAPVSAAAASSGAWAAATARERADALEDLLLLADALPSPAREAASRFPRISSSAPE